MFISNAINECSGLALTHTYTHTARAPSNTHRMDRRNKTQSIVVFVALLLPLSICVLWLLCCLWLCCMCLLLWFDLVGVTKGRAEPPYLPAKLLQRNARELAICATTSGAHSPSSGNWYSFAFCCFLAIDCTHTYMCRYSRTYVSADSLLQQHFALRFLPALLVWVIATCLRT